MTKEALLKASINEFEDKVQNCLLWEIERVYTSTGFCYIIKKKSKRISAALHYDMQYNESSVVGRFETNNILITTRSELPSDCILTYKNLTFAINEMGWYNETMGQWHYNANDIIKAISDEFLITDLNEIKQEIGINSYPIFSELELDYPIVPSYYAPDATQKSYVVLDITNGEGVTPVYYKGELIKQYKNDIIKLSFVNIDTKDALLFIKKIQEYSVKPDTQFGINALNTFIDEKLYQRSFNWRALSYSMEMRVNYYLKAQLYKQRDIIDINYEYYVANLIDNLSNI